MTSSLPPLSQAASTDTVRGDTNTTARLATPGSVDGVINTADLAGGADADWYKLTLNAGQGYQFNLTPGSTLDGAITLYNASGTQLAIADNFDTGAKEVLGFNSSTSGTYYVGISGYSGSTGSFTLASSVVPLDTMAAGTAGAQTLAVPGSATGRIDPVDKAGGLDEDWYKVTLATGTSYKFDLSASALDAVLTFYDANGKQISQTDDGGVGEGESFTYNASSNASFYVAVSSYGGGTLGAFSLNVAALTGTSMGTDTVPNDTTTTATLAVGATVNGTINSTADFGDWYKLALTGNTTYQFDLSSLKLDGQLAIYNSEGTYITSVDQGYDGEPETLVYTPAQSGTYFIGVSGYDVSIGDFTLKLTAPTIGGGVDTVGDSMDTASLILVPGQVAGVINTADDQDVYQVTLKANTTYAIDLTSNFIDGQLGLYDANGHQVEFADNGAHAGDPESLSYTPGTDGTYYIAVTGYGGTRGSFQLNIAADTSLASDFVGDTAATATATNIPSSQYGAVDAHSSHGGADADWYTMRLVAGATYRVDLAVADALDGRLTLFDTDGKTSLGTADDGYQGENEYFYYTPTVTGNYYVAVDGYAGSTGIFKLTVAQALSGNSGPDNVGNTPATAAALAVSPTAPGHVSGTINTSGDADWYKVTLAADTQYEVKVAAPTLDVVVELFDAQGKSLGYVDDNWAGGDPEHFLYTPKTAGTYYIGVSGYGVSVGDFLLDVSATPVVHTVDNIGNTYQTAAANLLTAGGAAARSAVDTAGDKDFFSVTLTAGTTYKWDMSSNILDSKLALYDPGGVFIDSADYGDVGQTETLYYTPTTSGTYFVRASGYADTTGSYALGMSAFAPVVGDVPGNSSSTVKLQVPGFVTNQIDKEPPNQAADTDWFSIRLHAGSSYLFYLYPNDNTLDGQLQMFDANGNPVYDRFGNGFVDNGWYSGDPETMVFVAPTTGNYFIQVSGYQGSTGRYSLYSAESVDVTQVAWSNPATYANVKWNQLDWAGLDLATWTNFDWSVINGSLVDWQALQYEHVYNSQDPAAHYTGWNLNFANSANPGNDKVVGGNAGDNVSLGQGLDNFSGGTGNDYANGGAGADILQGGYGNDTLDGGTGNDVLMGGFGSDVYYVDSAQDDVEEVDDTNQAMALFPLPPGVDPQSVGRSVDKVIASINYTLTTFVENLSLASAAGNLSGSGNALNNVLIGNEGNNVLQGMAGNDQIDGGAGVDTSVYTGALKDYTLTLGGSTGVATLVKDNRTTANNDGQDTLTNVERLKFSDLSIALDLGATQAAGKAVLMMGATLGPGFVADKSWAGAFTHYFDSGASVLDGANLLVSFGIISAFAGGADNGAFVNFVYNNVYGQAPSAATLASLVAPLNAHTTTQGQFLADMALSSTNQTHVGLAGYASGGLQFI
jgi:hypothetical protein